MLTLTGDKAIVTGGASGIGAAVVDALQRMGLRVASLDRQLGGPAELQYECDVSDHASLNTEVDAAVGELGGLHYSFVNAGVAGMGTVLDMPTAEWERVISVNLSGAFQTVQATGRHIKATGQGGAIVLTSSSAGILADLCMVHYSVSKMGVRQIARVAARELGPYDITVNAVAPGPTRTPMMGSADQLPGYLDRINEITPLGRMGETGDIVDAVIALFALRWVTGQTLAADGGITLVSSMDIPGVTPESVSDWYNT